MREEVITIKWPSGGYILQLPNILESIPMYSLKKKVFEWLFKNLWVDPVNEETVGVLDKFIPEWVTEHKDAWAKASKVFVTEYRDPKFSGTTGMAFIKRENNLLHAEVKRQKKAYERSEKILTLWTDTKSRYNR